MTTLTAPVVVSEEAQPTTPTSKYLRWLITAIAVAMSLYHMYVAAFGPPEAIIFRGTHLLFALTLVFLLYPTRPGRPAWRALDVLLMALGVASSCTSFSTTMRSSTASSTSTT